MHYRRLRRHGTPGAAGPLPTGRPVQHIGCAVDGCDRVHWSHSYCRLHWNRVKANGSPHRAPRPSELLQQVIDSTEETDECIEWPFKRNSKGYGILNDKRVHRLVLMASAGEPPPDKPMALHSCHNPPCCNAKHLRWGSAKDNTRDMMLAGRGASHGGPHGVRWQHPPDPTTSGIDQS